MNGGEKLDSKSYNDDGWESLTTLARGASIEYGTEFAPKRNEDFQEKLGEVALSNRDASRTEQILESEKLVGVRKWLIENGRFPIESEEAISKCFDYLLDRVIDGSLGDGSISRRLTLEGYKQPDWSEIDSRKQINDASVDIAYYMIESMRRIYQNEGVDEYMNQFPGAPVSGKELTQLLTISKDTLGMYASNPDALKKMPNFLRGVVECCKLGDDHAGAANICPYKIAGKTNKVDLSIPTSGKRRSDGLYRFYLNAPSGQAKMDFIKMYAKKCIDRRIPFDMKALGAGYKGSTGEKDTPTTIDTMNIYALVDHLDDSVEVLEEIKQEMPELVEKFGTPIATGDNLSYYAVAQSRGMVTWNDEFDKVSAWALHKTLLEWMHSAGGYSEAEKTTIRQELQNAPYAAPDGDVQMLRLWVRRSMPDIVTDFVREKGDLLKTGALKTKFKMNLKELFSIVNFGDTKHENYPFCFSDTFYSTEENT